MLLVYHQLSALSIDWFECFFFGPHLVTDRDHQRRPDLLACVYVCVCVLNKTVDWINVGINTILVTV